MVDRQPTRTPSHDGERHCGPRNMDGPAVRHGKLDDAGHEQKTYCGQARPEAKHEEHRKDDAEAGISDATRAKISAANRGKPKSVEQRAAHSALMKGRKLSPEHVEKITAARRGMKISAEARKKISSSLKGKTLSPVHVAKLRVRRASAETRAKIGAKSRGRRHTDEVRAVISAASIAAAKRRPLEWRCNTCGTTKLMDFSNIIRWHTKPECVRVRTRTAINLAPDISD
jgi:hypothetical protein